MEYYFGDQLRWSFGFGNPNKAAAVIATLLPVVWIGWALAWRIRNGALRWPTVLCAGAALCGGWWVLLQTLSRGGIVAALAAFGYLAWTGRRRGPRNRGRLVATVGVVMVAAFLLVSTQAARRGLEVSDDRSVSNRFAVWGGALRMLAENPQGVGPGNSGEVYMQWYQPLEATDRYRTIVNSYLTFAVERGLAVAALVAALGVWFWCVTASGERQGSWAEVRLGLRASLAAFAIAGIFSTTMEDWRVWVVPGVAMVFLAATLDRRAVSGMRPVYGAVIATAVGCAAVYAVGYTMSGLATPLRVSGSSWEAERLDIALRQSDADIRIAVLVDREVLGRDYGKLLRRLATRSGADVHVVSGAADVDGADLLIAAGRASGDIGKCEVGKVVLIAPAMVDESEAREILDRFDSVRVMLPAFDEDGRVMFWERYFESHDEVGKASASRLPGVGNDVGWVWDDIVEVIAGIPRGDR